MSDEPLYDPRILALFGEDIEELPDAKPKVPTVTLADVVADWDEKLIVESSCESPEMTRARALSEKVNQTFMYDHRYELLANGDLCFFCGNKSTNTHYVPSISEVRVRGVHSDMVAYRVCNKCLGRCVRRASLPRKDLEAYIFMLEGRGSIRGRVKLNDYKHEVISLKRMKMDVSGSLLDAYKESICIMYNDKGLEIEDAYVVNGILTLKVR